MDHIEKLTADTRVCIETTLAGAPVQTRFYH